MNPKIKIHEARAYDLIQVAESEMGSELRDRTILTLLFARKLESWAAADKAIARRRRTKR